MRFQGVIYRAHDPKWAFAPLSGGGAEKTGGRFNPPGLATLYTSLEIITALKEATHGLPRRMDPLTVCSYEVDCDNIADLASEAGRSKHEIILSDLACPWMLLAGEGKRVPSWIVTRRLMSEGFAGILVPSFAPGATQADVNLVLWTWGDALPHKVTPYDPQGRLPRNPSSWESD